MNMDGIDDFDSPYKTADYKITNVMPPSGVRSRYPQHWVFTLRGPGWDESKMYVANHESCGPHLIRSLQAAYDAGKAAK
jgi:hypothetical protein